MTHTGVPLYGDDGLTAHPGSEMQNSGHSTDHGLDEGASGPPSGSSPEAGLFARALAGAVALFFALVLWAATSQAQTPGRPVCNDTPGTGERIECTEDEASTSDIDIDISGVTISDITGIAAPGIRAKHLGTGNIDIESEMSTITTSGDVAVGSNAGIEAIHEGSGNIEIDSDSDSITTTGQMRAFGIYADHKGASGDVIVRTNSTDIHTRGHNSNDGIIAVSTADGKLNVDITGGSITTTVSVGVHLWHEYTGDGQAGPTTLDIRGNASITTLGDQDQLYDEDNPLNQVHGVKIIRLSDGLNSIRLEDVTIETTSARSYGIWSYQNKDRDADIAGNIEVDLLGGVGITTAGEMSHGIYAYHRGEHTTTESDIVIKAKGRNNTITTSGEQAHGLYGKRQSVVLPAADVAAAAADKVHMDLEDIEITTKGAVSFGVYGEHLGIGDIEINTRNATITTESEDIYADIGTLSHGIYARHANSKLTGDFVELAGNIDIDVQGGSIETLGTYSYGIRGDLEAGNGGEISIATGGGNTITTTGENSHGIVAYHFGTEEVTSSISIDIGGEIDVSGAGAQGVRVGALTSGAPDRVAAIGADGYRGRPSR